MSPSYGITSALPQHYFCGLFSAPRTLLSQRLHFSAFLWASLCLLLFLCVCQIFMSHDSVHLFICSIYRTALTSKSKVSTLTQSNAKENGWTWNMLSIVNNNDTDEQMIITNNCEIALRRDYFPTNSIWMCCSCSQSKWASSMSFTENEDNVFICVCVLLKIMEKKWDRAIFTRRCMWSAFCDRFILNRTRTLSASFRMRCICVLSSWQLPSKATIVAVINDDAIERPQS